MASVTCNHYRPQVAKKYYYFQTYNYPSLPARRDNIESAHGDEVAQLRSLYSDEDNKQIQKFLEAKKLLKQETHVQEINGQMVQETDQGASSGMHLK